MRERDEHIWTIFIIKFLLAKGGIIFSNNFLKCWANVKYFLKWQMSDKLEPFLTIVYLSPIAAKKHTSKFLNTSIENS